MQLHLYFVLSAYTPVAFTPNCDAALPDASKRATALLLKLFARPLDDDAAAAHTPANAGDHGVATIIITNKLTVLSNPALGDLAGNYPQLEKINMLAQPLAEPTDRDFSTAPSVAAFARKVQQLEGVTIHGIGSAKTGGL